MKICDIATVKRGSSPRPIINFVSTEGYPWLKISDFSYGERYVYNTKEFIIEAGLKNTRYVPKGTLIVTNSATPGIPIFLGEDMCLHDGFLYFENISPDVNPLYLYYFILKNRDYLVSQGNGSVFTNLKKEILENTPIMLPTQDEQQHIVDILGSIDDKIAFYEDLVCKLEYDGELLFKDIFENPTVEKEKIELFSIANFYSGYSYSGDELCDKSATCLVTIKNFDRNGGFKIDGFKPINIAGNVKPTMYANVGDLLVAHTDLTQNADIIGNPILLHNLSVYEKTVISMDLVKVESDVLPNELLYYILKSSEFKSHALGFCAGTTVLHLNKNALRKYSFYMPTNKMAIFCLCEKLNAIFERIRNAIMESKKLSELKQLYLQKFFR